MLCCLLGLYRFSMNKDLYRLQVTEFCIHRINFHCEHNIQCYNVSLHGKFIYRLEKTLISNYSIQLISQMIKCMAKYSEKNYVAMTIEDNTLCSLYVSIAFTVSDIFKV